MTAPQGLEDCLFEFRLFSFVFSLSDAEVLLQPLGDVVEREPGQMHTGEPTRLKLFFDAQQAIDTGDLLPPGIRFSMPAREKGPRLIFRVR